MSPPSKPTVDTSNARKISFVIEKKTIVSIWGEAISANKQYIYPKIFDKDGKQLTTKDEVDRIYFMGQGEYCEIQYGDGPTILVYGPFDEQRKLELEFDHVGDDDDEDKSNAKIIKDKIIELSDDSTTSTSIISYDNGYTTGKTVIDLTTTVVRCNKENK